MRGSAEIVGGGIGGLFTGYMLAKQGWRVRINERHSQKRAISFFSRLGEILETRMTLRLLHCHGPHLFRHQAGQSFVDCHSQIANTLPPQADRRRQHHCGLRRRTHERRRLSAGAYRSIQAASPTGAGPARSRSR